MAREGSTSLSPLGSVSCLDGQDLLQKIPLLSAPIDDWRSTVVDSVLADSLLNAVVLYWS